MAIDALPDLPFNHSPTIAMYNDSPFSDDLRTAGLSFDHEWLHLTASMLTARELGTRLDTATATVHLGKGFWVGLRVDGNFGGEVLQITEHTLTYRESYTSLVYDEKASVWPTAGYQYDGDYVLAGVAASTDRASARAIVHTTLQYQLRVGAGWEQHMLLNANDTWREIVAAEQGPLVLAGYDGSKWGFQLQVNLHRAVWRVSYSF